VSVADPIAFTSDAAPGIYLDLDATGHIRQILAKGERESRLAAVMREGSLFIDVVHPADRGLAATAITSSQPPARSAGPPVSSGACVSGPVPVAPSPLARARTDGRARRAASSCSRRTVVSISSLASVRAPSA